MAAIQTVTFIATLVVRYTLIVSLLLIIATYAQGDVFEFCTKWSAVATGWIVNISWAALTMVFAVRCLALRCLALPCRHPSRDERVLARVAERIWPY